MRTIKNSIEYRNIKMKNFIEPGIFNNDIYIQKYIEQFRFSNVYHRNITIGNSIKGNKIYLKIWCNLRRAYAYNQPIYKYNFSLKYHIGNTIKETVQFFEDNSL